MHPTNLRPEPIVRGARATRCSGMPTLLAALGFAATLLVGLPSLGTAADDLVESEAVPSDAAPSGSEVPTPAKRAGAATIEAPPASPSKPDDQESKAIFTPSVGEEWVEILSSARRTVLVAYMAADEANAAYAQALYQKRPPGPELDAIVQQRALAKKDLQGAYASAHEVVARARAAGVSEKTLDLYEASMPR